MRLFLDDAITMLPQLRASYADDRPDLFLYDIAGAPARILAEEYGVAALQIGSHVDVAELEEGPPSVEVHPWVPQLAILERADAFLTHAGMGGSSEGLWAGVPMIAAPQDVDKFSNADALVAAGVAQRVDSGTVTAAELRAALLELTGSAEVAARSADIRRDLRERGGVGLAVQLVEAHLVDHPDRLPAW